MQPLNVVHIFRSRVRTTENYHENRTHEIHFDSKHRLRHWLALFSIPRTRPIFNRFYMFFNASSRVWPSLMHPGRAGTSTENPPSSLRSSTTVSFFVFLPITSCSIYLVLLSFCDLPFNRRTDPTVFAYHSSPIYWVFFGLQDCEGRSGGGLPDCESGGVATQSQQVESGVLCHDHFHAAFN